jgi:hypothetical protein
LKIITQLKRNLLRNKYIKRLNKKRKLKKFYGKGKKPGKRSETILFWSTGGMVAQTNIEGVLACALKLRGHNVKMVLCDGVYTACAKRVDMPDVPPEKWSTYCKSCIRQNSGVFEKLGIEYTFISDLVTPDRKEQLRSQADKITFDNYKNLSINGTDLGSHIESAMLRHTRGGSFEGLEEILKEYAFTVLTNAEASNTAIKKINPTRIFMSHGIYADWGPALTNAIHEKIQTSSYICCYLTAHFFFGTVRSFDETFLTVNEKSWNTIKFNGQSGVQKKRLENFLERRYKTNMSQDLKGLLKGV